MKLSKALFMAIVLVLGALYLHKFKAPEQIIEATEQAPAEQLAFEDIDIQKINRIGVSFADSKFVVLKSRNNPLEFLNAYAGQSSGEANWVLLEPAGAPANTKHVNTILSGIQLLKVQRRIEADELEEDLQAYGLKPPELIVDFSGLEGSYTLEFGKQNRITGRRYARLRSEAGLFLAEEPQFLSFRLNEREIRNQFPVQFPVDDVVSVSVVRGKQQMFEFKRNTKDASWEFSSSDLDMGASLVEFQKMQLDAPLIKRLLTSLTEIKVKEFIDSPRGNSGAGSVADPEVVIRLEIADTDGKPRVLALFFGEQTHKGAPGEETIVSKDFYLRVSGSPWIYQLKRGYPLEIVQPAAYFRSRNPFSQISVESVEKILIETSGDSAEAFLVERDSSEENSWNVVSQQNSKETTDPANPKAVETWITAFSKFRVLSYPAMNVSQQRKLSIDKPVLSVEVVPRGSVRGYKLIVAEALSLPGQNSTSTSGGADDPRAPRLGVVRGGLRTGISSLMTSALLSGGEWQELGKGVSYFKKNTQ